MNLCSLSRAQLDVTAILIASVAALAARAFGLDTLVLAIEVAIAGFAALALFRVLQTRRLIGEANDVCRRITEGDFEARILSASNKGLTGGLLGTINDMIDDCDAFVREASAAMSAVQHNKYFRRILPGGLHGGKREHTGILSQGQVSFSLRRTTTPGFARPTDGYPFPTRRRQVCRGSPLRPLHRLGLVSASAGSAPQARRVATTHSGHSALRNGQPGAG